MKKEQTAYCLIRKNSRKYTPGRFSPMLIDHRLPIYWIPKTAKEDMKKWDCEMVKVIIKPIK